MENGHLNILIWARANGLAWDRVECLDIAEFNEYNDMVEWIRAN